MDSQSAGGELGRGREQRTECLAVRVPGPSAERLPLLWRTENWGQSVLLPESHDSRQNLTLHSVAPAKAPRKKGETTVSSFKLSPPSKEKSQSTKRDLKCLLIRSLIWGWNVGRDPGIQQEEHSMRCNLVNPLPGTWPRSLLSGPTAPPGPRASFLS